MELFFLGDKMGKNIAFCADGTCNGPQEVDDQGLPDPTNVFKLFVRLSGELSSASLALADEQESQETDAGGNVTQVAKYIDGVGDTSNPILKLFGGAAGVGLIARVVRGYTFISRSYKPGDAIYLNGFSRGAYTARALAGLIRHVGLLDPNTYDPTDNAQAYRLGAGAWYAYQQTIAVANDTQADFDKFGLDLPGFFYRAPQSYVTDVPIRAIGVWDTVSSYGFSAAYDALGARGDLLPLDDADLDPLVAYGFHALSIDEQRPVFVPVLWNARQNIVQRLFPGAHADVGGGYSISAGESKLSDIALEWMVAQLRGVGLHVSPQGRFSESPDPTGIAHQPWRYVPWTALGPVPRAELNNAIFEIDPSVQLRCQAASVVFDPGAAKALVPLAQESGRYAPANILYPAV